jgi:hypothetical protein
MTKYEFLQTCSLDDMAAFVTALVEGTEDRLLGLLSQQGVDASLVRASFAIRQAQNRAMLACEHCPSEAQDAT